jgi:hypothetical protein
MDHSRRKAVVPVLILLLGVGCASMSGPLLISWEPVSRPGQTNGVAAIESDHLVLENREIGAGNTYSTPLTIECEVSPESVVSSDFGIKFVPTVAAPTSGEIDRMFVLSSVNGPNMMAEFSVASRQGAVLVTRSAWEKSADGQWLVVKPGDVCHIRLVAYKDHLEIGLNGQTFVVNGTGVPYERFRIQLSCLGAKNRWRVLNFAVR